VTKTSAQGVRARVRAELTEEIKQTARAHLASDGSAALSLRAVARELGMASSAIYRYFPSREILLTALIIDAYNAVGARVEEAEAACDRHDFEQRWLTIGNAVRGWALENPHEYALIYGSPVPGYAAPEDTIAAATRVTTVMLRLLTEAGVARGDSASSAGGIPVPALPDTLRDELEGNEYVGGTVPPDLLAAGLAAWAEMFGMISFELFGHFHNVISDLDDFFDHTMRSTAARLIP
jgi:AcrR family transcriptional regulator